MPFFGGEDGAVRKSCPKEEKNPTIFLCKTGEQLDKGKQFENRYSKLTSETD